MRMVSDLKLGESGYVPAGSIYIDYYNSPYIGSKSWVSSKPSSSSWVKVRRLENNEFFVDIAALYNEDCFIQLNGRLLFFESSKVIGTESLFPVKRLRCKKHTELGTAIRI